MRRNLGVVTIFMLVTSSILAVQASPAKPKPVLSHEIFPVVPETLEEMYASSDEVVDVEILSSVARVVGEPANPYVRTFYTAKVRHSRKGLPKERLVFSQSAGEIEFPDHILRASSEPLQIGQRYIVFLRRNELFGGRILVGERSGAFKIRNGRIEPQGFGKVADEQRHLTERMFGDELDRLSKRSRPKEQ
jgi:hypothetical protein